MTSFEVWQQLVWHLHLLRRQLHLSAHDLAISAGLVSKKVTDSSKENQDDILGDGGCPDNVSDPGNRLPLDGQLFGRT